MSVPSPSARWSSSPPLRWLQKGVQSPSWANAKTILGLLAAWTTLNVCFGADLANPSWKALLPSVDATALLGLYAAIAGWRLRLPNLFHWLLLPIPLCALLLRIADGIEEQFFHRKFNVSLDLHLIREGVRLLHQTMPLSRFVVFCIASVLGLLLGSWLIHAASRIGFRALQRQLGRWVFCISLLTYLIINRGPAMAPLETHAASMWDAFGPSVTLRLGEEVNFALHAAGYRRDKAEDMASVRQRLDTLPHDLGKLEGVDVHLILVESYGYCSFERESQRKAHTPVLKETEERVRAAGFHTLSNFWDSPTYGAGSQFAQLTLGTGIRVSDDFQYRLVMSSDAHSLPRFFNERGFRTVFAMPGTRMDWPEGSFWGFDKLYDRWDFDYAGPVLGWGELPDQYTLDAIRRSELKEGHPPTFAMYALITSHGPWATVPPIVREWERIQDGKIYGRLGSRRFAGLSWSNMKRAPEAYAATISYDFKVLTSFLTQFVSDDALVIVLGDHQPVAKVSGRNRPHSVPVHLFSKRRDLLAPFEEKRGFKPGLFPDQPLPHAGLEEFLPALLQDFSASANGSVPQVPQQ